MLRRSMACGDSPVYSPQLWAISHFPMTYLVTGVATSLVETRLQPACIVCVSGRLILSVAFQSLVL